jgi:hypothetical protein
MEMDVEPDYIIELMDVEIEEFLMELEEISIDDNIEYMLVD